MFAIITLTNKYLTPSKTMRTVAGYGKQERPLLLNVSNSTGHREHSRHITCRFFDR